MCKLNWYKSAHFLAVAADIQMKRDLFLQGLTGRAFERAKEVDEKCRNENQVERGEQIDVNRMEFI
jgi:hypothetical protein